MLKSLVHSVSVIKGLFKAVAGGLLPSPSAFCFMMDKNKKLLTIKKGKPGFNYPLTGLQIWQLLLGV